MRTTLALLALLFSAHANADVLVAANRGGSVATLIEPDSMTLIAQVDAGPQPHEVAVSPDGTLAYVSNYVSATGSTLSVIDLQARRKVKEIPLGNLRGPHGLEQRGGKIYFTAESSGAVGRYDPVADRIDWVGRTSANGGHMLAVRHDGSMVYTGNIQSDSVSLIPVSGAESSARKIIPVLDAPEAIAVSPDGRWLWAGSVTLNGGIAVIDLESESVVATLAHGQMSYRIAFSPDGRYVFVSRQKSVVVYDAATRNEVKRIATAGNAFAILFRDDGRFAFVSMGGPDRIAKIDVLSLAIVGEVAASPVPDGLGYARQPVGPRRRAVRP